MNKKQVVKKDNALIESRCNLTLNQQKLVLTVIAQIKREDDDFKKYFISIRDFKELMDLKSTAIYSKIKQAAKDLRAKPLEIPLSENKILYTGWFSSILVDNEGEVGFRFDPDLKPYLLQLQSRFTTYQLKNILFLKSKYSIRVYELLKQYENLKHRRFELSELRELLFVKPTIYPVFSSFKKRVLEPAEKDINKNTDISISYSTVKTGRKVTGIMFSIVSQGPGTKKIKSIPSKVLNMVPEAEREACMKLVQEVYEKYGEDGLIFCLEKCNSKKESANTNYSGYLNTVVDLDLWSVEKAKRQIKAGTKAAVDELNRLKMEAELKAATEDKKRKTVKNVRQKMLENLVDSVDIVELDAFILGEDLSLYNAKRFKGGKRDMLRTQYVESFIASGE